MERVMREWGTRINAKQRGHYQHDFLFSPEFSCRILVFGERPPIENDPSSLLTIGSSTELKGSGVMQFEQSSEPNYGCGDETLGHFRVDEMHDSSAALLARKVCRSIVSNHVLDPFETGPIRSAHRRNRNTTFIRPLDQRAYSRMALPYSLPVLRS